MFYQIREIYDTFQENFIFATKLLLFSFLHPLLLRLEFRNKSENPLKKPYFSRIRENFLQNKQNIPENLKNMNKAWYFVWIFTFATRLY